MDSEPDLQTVFLTHEVEHGLNPEVNLGVFERIWAKRATA